MKRLAWPAAVVVALAGGFVLGRTALFSNWSGLWNWLTANEKPIGALGSLATAVAAPIGAIGLVIAGVAAFAAVSQLRSQKVASQLSATALDLQRQTAFAQSARECLWHYTGLFRDYITRKDRNQTSIYGRALTALDQSTWKYATPVGGFLGTADPDVVAVLNFFDAIAFLRKRGDMDQELAWNAFGVDATSFWDRSDAFVVAYRLGSIDRTGTDLKPNVEDKTFWTDFAWWVIDLAECQRLKDAGG